MQQMEELRKFRMSNTKRYFETLYSGVTPYANELEFISQLENVGVVKDSKLYNWALWKGLTFNLILSTEIDAYIKTLKK